MRHKPKLWPLGVYPEAEAKVRQLQKVGTKWLRASGPGWVAEKQDRFSNIKFEYDSGFILLQFESLDKYRILPPWAYNQIVVVGEDIPTGTINYPGIVFELRYSTNLNQTTFEQRMASEEFIRDVTSANAFYVRREDESGNAYYVYFAPTTAFPGVPAYYVEADAQRGGYAAKATATDIYIAPVYLEPVLVAGEFQPTRHTVFLDPKSLSLSKYDTTFIGPSYLALRRDIAVADKNKKVFFAEYLVNLGTKTETCYLLPKETYPAGKIDFSLHEGRTPDGWLYPLSPFHLHIGELGFTTTRPSSSNAYNAKVVRGKGVSTGLISVSTQFEHTTDLGYSALLLDTSSVDVFENRALVVDIGGPFCIYSKAGAKLFQFAYPDTGFMSTSGNFIPQYELPIERPKAASIWKNKVAVYSYKRYAAQGGDYEWVIGGWDLSEPMSQWGEGGPASPRPFDFEFVAQTRTSPYTTIGIALRNNRIFQFAIEAWVEGDAVGGTANVNRPVVFVYKWGGELIKKIDLFTELGLENVGYLDAFLEYPTHSIYASPF